MNLISLKGVLIATLAIILLNIPKGKSNTDIPQRVSSWEYVTGFDINSEGNYMVVAMCSLNRELLFESYYDGFQWSNPTPINTINSFGGNRSNIGGHFFTLMNPFFTTMQISQEARGGMISTILSRGVMAGVNQRFLKAL